MVCSNGMSKTMSKQSEEAVRRTPRRASLPMTPQDRAAIIGRTRGAWKHRSLKKDLQTLARVRRGWDRKII